MEFILSQFSKSSNYLFQNNNNLYNFLINILNSLENKDDKKMILTSLRIHVGITFENNFKEYLLKKLPKSEILKFYLE
jgi:hypothetical protein